MNEQREAQKGGGGERLGFAPPGTGTGAPGGRRATTPASLRQRAEVLRGSRQPGDGLGAAAALEEAAAQLDAVAELREAASIVVRSYDASDCPTWPAVVVLAEVLHRLEATR